MAEVKVRTRCAFKAFKAFKAVAGGRGATHQLADDSVVRSLRRSLVQKLVGVVALDVNDHHGPGLAVLRERLKTASCEAGNPGSSS